MNQDSNLLSELSAALPELNKSETKVANGRFWKILRRRRGRVSRCWRRQQGQ